MSLFLKELTILKAIIDSLIIIKGTVDWPNHDWLRLEKAIEDLVILCEGLEKMVLVNRG